MPVKPPRPPKAPRAPRLPPEDQPPIEIRVEEPCGECFGRGWIAQGRVTERCRGCGGLGVRAL